MSGSYARIATDDAMLAYIRAYVAKRGYSPSMSEIANGLGFASASAVLHRLNRMEKLGLVVRARGIARTIRVVAA
jgi:SOS-response transcriptional repressor LexA